MKIRDRIDNPDNQVLTVCSIVYLISNIFGKNCNYRGVMNTEMDEILWYVLEKGNAYAAQFNFPG